MDYNKKIIIDKFKANVKGKRVDSSGFNARHDGAAGHWLEIQMGITPNAANEADLLGYEMKNDTTSKTTFGDWSPDIALWKAKTPYSDIPRLDRDSEFLKYFGKPNAKKNNRLSWSGEPAPKINVFNRFGQKLGFDQDENIVAYYSYSEDLRSDKASLIPDQLKRESLVIAKWLKASMKNRLDRKFNDKGWFKCYRNNAGIYDSIGFGDPIDYEDWLSLIKTGAVFFDSGMYAGNSRPYSQWRANNNYWDEMVKERY